jgi:hypothetical protein
MFSSNELAFRASETTKARSFLFGKKICIAFETVWLLQFHRPQTSDLMVVNGVTRSVCEKYRP